MKNIIAILSILTINISASCAQTVNINTFNTGNNEGKYFKDLNNYFSPFLGTWEWQSGNRIFKVTLWKEAYVENQNGNRPSFYEDVIKGHFEMIHVSQGSQPWQTVMYTSQKKIGQSTSDWFPVISGASHDGNNFRGIIYDNSVPYNPEYSTGVRGNLELSIVQNTSPMQLHWNVTLPQGTYGTDQPTEFNIPTIMILKKVN